MSVGFVTGFCYLVTIFYSINDIDALMATTYTNPLAEVYRQATGSNAGACGLLVVILLPTVCNCIGEYQHAPRMNASDTNLRYLYHLRQNAMDPCAW